MSTISEMYNQLPKNQKKLIRRIYYLDEKILTYCLTTGIIETISRGELKDAPHYSYWEYGKPESHDIQPPFEPDKENIIRDKVKLKMSNSQLYDGASLESPPYDYQMTPTGPFVAELRNVQLFGQYALPITRDGKIPLEIKTNSHEVLSRRLTKTYRKYGIFRMYKWLVEPGVNESSPFDMEVAVNLHTMRDQANMAYGHYLLEMLPRLRGVEYYKKITGRTPQIIVDKNIKNWQLNLLCKTGINEERIVRWQKDEASIEYLVLPMWPKKEYLISNFDWVENILTKNSDYKEYLDATPDRVFISRRNQSRRNVSNKEDLNQWLKKKNFSVICPEEIDIDKQIALFKGANIIISVSGSGLANILFSENCSIIEILPSNGITSMVYEISQILGHDYHWIYGKNGPQGGSFHDDVEVPLRKLDICFNNCLSESDG